MYGAVCATGVGVLRIRVDLNSRTRSPFIFAFHCDHRGSERHFQSRVPNGDGIIILERNWEVLLNPFAAEVLGGKQYVLMRAPTPLRTAH